MRTRALGLLALSATSLLACATPHTHTIAQRVSLGYTDRRFFAMQHFDALAPDPGPSAGLREYGGTLIGRACGADINFDADYRGSFLRLVGFVKNLDVTKVSISSVANEKPSRLEVRDHDVNGARVRTIEGHIGSEELPELGRMPEDLAQAAVVMALAMRMTLAPRHHEVELMLTRDRLAGKVGSRRFDLQAVGDEYFGTMSLGGYALPFRLRGRGSLWSMPAADQAAILPFVLTCLLDDRHLVQDVDLIYER